MGKPGGRVESYRGDSSSGASGRDDRGSVIIRCSISSVSEDKEGEVSCQSCRISRSRETIYYDHLVRELYTNQLILVMVVVQHRMTCDYQKILIYTMIWLRSRLLWSTLLCQKTSAV